MDEPDIHRQARLRMALGFAALPVGLLAGVGIGVAFGVPAIGAAVGAGLGFGLAVVMFAAAVVAWAADPRL